MRVEPMTFKLPPNFAQSPEEVLRAGRVEIVVEQVLPVLRISIVTGLGNVVPLYLDVPPLRSNGTYGEF
jgi:hypothetical protein